MQSISEHEAWKQVLEELPKAEYVCVAIIPAAFGPGREFREALYLTMKRKVMGHRRIRSMRNGLNVVWPCTRRGNLCRRLFVERMIRETAV